MVEGVHRDLHILAEIRGDDLLIALTDGDDRMLDDGVVATVAGVLRGVINNGTVTRVEIGVPAAGKTGATDDSVDAWFAGYAPVLSVAAWIGNPPAGNVPLLGEPTNGELPAECLGRLHARR